VGSKLPRMELSRVDQFTLHSTGIRSRSRSQHLNGDIDDMTSSGEMKLPARTLRAFQSSVPMGLAAIMNASCWHYCGVVSLINADRA
jgi:hypothetical protein